VAGKTVLSVVNVCHNTSALQNEYHA